MKTPNMIFKGAASRIGTRKTIKYFEQKVAELETAIEGVHEENRGKSKLIDESERKLTEARTLFVDLKEKLYAAEVSNQFMRGYIARIQEDDIAREELLTIGDPNGEQKLVPKRKSTAFERPDDFLDTDRPNQRIGSQSFSRFGSDDRPKPRHWLRY